MSFNSKEKYISIKSAGKSNMHSTDVMNISVLFHCKHDLSSKKVLLTML